ncbi:BLOC-1-related complex subunit 6 isoform X1 [Diachasma alloeum]|uniref:BLOC-1-related complex subunit 6 isoform X1 n=2 Tax=Diachasma alloeum TaxID=454923 RepID=UPI0007383362|nr:BLOC-1-related complex subunit 6 isoform X1 [Diachasma alloeum]
MSRCVSSVERNTVSETRMDEEPDVPARASQPQNSYKIAPMDFDEDRPQEMTASYSEISFDSQSSPPISELRSLVESPDIDDDEFMTDERMKKIDALADRPHMLNLKSGEGSPEEEEECPDLPGYRKAMGYLRLEGTVMQEGDMVLFVAEDLENKIKLSSPVTKKGDTPSFPGSRSSTPCLYRQALNPQLPLPDHNALNELEMEARKIATSVDSLTENLAAILHSASAVTVDCLETYRDAVCKTCDAVDHNIKSMYQLMAKCEELSKSMGPIYKLAEQVKEMKRLLDLFEGAMNL